MEHSQHDEDILDVAAGWIVKLRSPAASDSDRVEFSQWLNASSRHERAFDEMLATWEIMGSGAELPDSVWDPKAQQLSLLERCKHHLSQWLPGPANSRYWLTSLGCTAAVLMVAVAVMLDTPPKAQPVVYQTLAGEAKRIELPDQSIIELNTRSKIEVIYSKNQRLVKLLQGEAYFEVEGNKSRPFIVDVGRGTVTAVGTAFNIRLGKMQDWVAVTEGVVRVKQKKDPTTPYPESKFVQADQHLSLSGTGLGPATALNNDIYWLEHTLSFDNTALTEALAELNRYLANPVEFDQQALGHLRLSGTFSTTAPQATLAAILATFSLQLEGNTVSLSSAASVPQG